MTVGNLDVSKDLVVSAVGSERAAALDTLLAPMLPDHDDAGDDSSTMVTRAQFAAAMNVLLFADLLDRVPSGAAYVADVVASGARVCFDHGAIRTVAMPQGDTGALPRGELSFRRILEPLGYEVAALYPLPKLRMTGRAYRHVDHPETIPQFFVSELHVNQFDDDFAVVAANVFGGSVDPLDASAREALDGFAENGRIPLSLARQALPTIVAAFGRHHPVPTIADYAALKAQSAEAAWIATEGNAFNHATDRVAHVVQLADDQRALGRPMKERVEHSANGRVRQTAFRADHVERQFVGGDGAIETLTVPGSFYEFISRDVDPATGKLDLSFDSGNATGIFHMTKVA